MRIPSPRPIPQMPTLYSASRYLPPPALHLGQRTQDHSERSRIRPPHPQANIMDYYGVVERCNKFHGELDESWAVHVLDNPIPVGYMLDELKRATSWDNTAFQVHEERRVVHLQPELAEGEDAVARCNLEFLRLADQNAANLGRCLEKWLEKKRDFHPLVGLTEELTGIKVPAPLRGVIGQVTRGVHLNVYTYKKLNGSDQAMLHVWVSKRGPHVAYANKLDQIAAGGMDPEDNMDYMATMAREAYEEAGLTIDQGTRDVSDKDGFVGQVQAGDVITFYDKKDAAAGPEQGHLEPGARMTYDLEVSPDYTPIRTEPEAAAGFVLKSLVEVKRDLINAMWKPNSGLVMLDFLMRHRVIEGQPEDMARLDEGLHTPLPLSLEINGIPHCGIQ